MQEYTFTTNFNEKVAQIILRVAKGDDYNQKNIFISCVYNKTKYECSTDEEITNVNHTIIAFKSQGLHKISLEIVKKDIVMTIESILLKDKIVYELNNKSDLSTLTRFDLEKKVCELEKEILMLKDEIIPITDDMMAPQVYYEKSWLEDDRAHSLFFDDLKVWCEKNDSSRWLKLYQQSIGSGNNVNNQDKIFKNSLNNCFSSKIQNIGIEHIIHKYSITYSHIPIKNSVCIKGILEIECNPGIKNAYRNIDKIYTMELSHLNIDKIYTIITRKQKPTYGTICISQNNIKINMSYLRSDPTFALKVPIDGVWYDEKKSGKYIMDGILQFNGGSCTFNKL